MAVVCPWIRNVVWSSARPEKLHAYAPLAASAISCGVRRRDEIVSEMEHYASDRSDRWQNSERGQSHEAWKQEWEVLDVTVLDAIDEIDEPAMAHANELESLRSQPE